MAPLRRTGEGPGRIAPSALANLRSEVAALEDLGVDLLRRRWRAMMGRPAPAHLSRSLLFRILAYRLQIEALGIDVRASDVQSTVNSAQGDRSASSPRTLKALVRPGTLLTRDYSGVTHRVMAMEEGFSWNGRTFRSLSEVATAITGTRWNGPRFFGLRSLPLADRRSREPRRRADDAPGVNGGQQAGRSSERADLSHGAERAEP